MPTARRETNRKAAPWDSKKRLKARHETGELEIRDNGDTIMQACRLKPVPLPYAPEPNWHAALERVSLLMQMPSQKSFGFRTKKQAYSVKK